MRFFGTSRRTWGNWAGNQRATPTEWHSIDDAAAVAPIIVRSAEQGRSVRVVGAGHSFTDLARTDGVMLDVDGLTGFRVVDGTAGLVEIGAGTRLVDLNSELREVGLALPNLGDIDKQSLAGATATGTHGTGAGYRCISDAIAGITMVTGTGDEVTCSESERPELFDLARVSLGALGVITSITLRCVPAFDLYAVEEILPIDEILESFDELAATNDHVELYWFPGTSIGQRKVNNRTDRAIDRRSRVAALAQDELLGNVAFGALCRLNRFRPGTMAQMMSKVLKVGDRTDYIAPSHEVFCSPRRVRFVEMEYGIPRAALHDAFSSVRRAIADLGGGIGFPIEVRVLGADDIALSMAHGRDSAFIAVHVEVGSSHEAYFAAIEAIMAAHDGRPHWGKLHRRSAAELRGLYPAMDRFDEARHSLDPRGVLTNPYLDRVLSPHRGRR